MRSCLNCEKVITINKKMVRGHCQYCYHVLLKKGEIPVKNQKMKATNCSGCNSSLEHSKSVKGLCLKCYRISRTGVDTTKRNCRDCYSQLDNNSKYGYCNTCYSKSLGIIQDDKVITRIKILLVKWKWGYIKPHEMFEIASIWVEWFTNYKDSSVKVRSLDTMDVNGQLKEMINDFKEYIKTSNKI